MSFFDVSLETANKFYAWGWRGSIIGATITAIAVIFLMWGTRVRDHNFESQMSATNLAAAQANERAAGLEVVAAETQVALERERIERLQLEERVRPRSLSDAQRATLLPALKAVPKGAVFVIAKAFDEEAGQFAKQIIEVLAGGGFEPKREGIPAPMGFGIPGAWIFVRDMKHPPPHAVPIQSAFESIGVKLVGQPATQVPDLDSVIIAIGAKP